MKNWMRAVWLYSRIVFRRWHGIMVWPGFAWEIARDVWRKG